MSNLGPGKETTQKLSSSEMTYNFFHEFGGQFGELKKVAFLLLNSPGSSSAIEWFFSEFSYQLNSRSNRLVASTATTFEGAIMRNFTNWRSEVHKKIKK